MENVNVKGRALSDPFIVKIRLGALDTKEKEKQKYRFQYYIINSYTCQMMHRLRRYDAFASQHDEGSNCTATQ